MKRLLGYFLSISLAVFSGIFVTRTIFWTSHSVKKIVNLNILNNRANVNDSQKIDAKFDKEKEREKEYIPEEEDGSYVRFFSRRFHLNLDENSSLTGNEFIQSQDGISSDNINITAKAFRIERLSDGKVFSQKEEDRALPIASITKLVTAVTALRLMGEEKSVLITDAMLRTYGNEAKLRRGEKLRVNELLYPLLMVSSNDAGEALAMGYEKGRKNFIEEMNKWAQEIGAYQTYFDDPTGLSEYNVSTTRDMSIMIKAIIKDYNQVLDITSQKSKTVRTHTWTNPTHFLNLTAYKGGKNGFTYEAGRTSIALFDIDNGDKTETYIVSVLNSQSRDRDVLDLLRLVQDIAKSSGSVVGSR